MIIDYNIKPENLKEKLNLFWKLSGEKILKIESETNVKKNLLICQKKFMTKD